MLFGDLVSGPRNWPHGASYDSLVGLTGGRLAKSTDHLSIPPTLLRLKIAQQPYILWSLAPKAIYYEAFKP